MCNSACIGVFPMTDFCAMTDAIYYALHALGVISVSRRLPPPLPVTLALRPTLRNPANHSIWFPRIFSGSGPPFPSPPTKSLSQWPPVYFVMTVLRAANLLCGVLCGRPLGAEASLWCQFSEDGAAVEVLIASDMHAHAKYGRRHTCNMMDA